MSREAETLYERIDRLRSHDLPAIPPEAVARLLTSWAKAFSGSSRKDLMRRLTWDRIAPEEAAAAFLGERLPDPEPSPWTRVLRDVVRESQDRTPERPEDPERNRPSGRPGLPFVDLWLPWLDVVSREIEAEVWDPFGPRARRALKDHLLERLARLGEMTAFELFEEARASRDEVEGAYRGFVSDCLADPVGRLYARFPVLGRRCAGLAGDWASAVTELSRRLVADLEALKEAFAGGGALGRVEDLRCGLSDPHGRGRRVALLTFERGSEVVYKPRCVDGEAAMERWLHWCRGEGLFPVPPAPRVVAREGYGWVEAVTSEELTDVAEVREYYRRAGVLVALTWLLGARDLHSENVVATSGGPVVVDGEMLLQPVLTRMSSGSNREREDEVGGADSCRATGLLTYPEPGADGETDERGGLRAVARRPSSRSRRLWTDVNRDTMEVEPAEGWIESEANVPRLAGEPVPPEDHRGAIAEGFEAAYRFFLDHREQLDVPEGLLGELSGVPVRIVLRRSQEYANVLSLTSLPRYQRSGISASLLREALLRPFAGRESRPVLWPLVEDERTALERRDIPRFEVEAGATTLSSASGTEIHGYLALSGVEAARRRLRAMGAEDLERQLEIGREILAPPPPPSIVGTALVEPEADSFVEECRRLARSAGRQLLEEGGAESLDEARISLAEGRLGVALFWAALHRLGESGYAGPARDLLDPLLRDPGGPAAAGLRTERGLGICSGRGSLAWGLVWLGLLLEDEELSAAGRDCVEPVRTSVPGVDIWDLEGGVAGALLGMLTVHQATGDRGSLEVAEECGERLLRAQEIFGSTGAAWRNPAGLALAGWAHGAAGTARALAALGEVTGEERYRVAAVAALGFERVLFDSERGNWPVLVRPSEGPVRREWMTAWCHGAPGGALARVLLPELFEDSVLVAERDAALETTRTAGLGAVDHLCCGSIGRAGVLLTAGERLGRPELVDAARELVRSMRRRAARRGGWRLDESRRPGETPPPGLLKGLSGIGYQLCRFVDPELPDFLAFELPAERDERTEEIE